MIRYTAERSAVSASSSSCPSSSSAPPAEELPPLQVRVSIFFDGTGNNLFNTRSRLSGGSRTTDSYANDYSNVANLAMHIIPDDHPDNHNHHISLYVEGIGTYHRSTDDTSGSAFGMGDRGVKDRVTSCLRRIAEIVNSHASNTNRQVTMLKIDPFGFSRGAAAARHFIHRYFTAGDETTDLAFPDIISQYDVTISDIKFPFVGLFDTVASFGTDHDNDTTDLHLDSLGRGQVLYTLHLAAADEHRLNFPLTNANSKGAGMEIFVPGVHSDVGGGYNNGGDQNETNLILMNISHGVNRTSWTQIQRIQHKYASDMRRWIRLGWYVQSDFVLSPTYNPADSNSLLTNCEPLKVNRRGISNEYRKVPLLIMSKYAHDHGQLNFEADVTDKSRLLGSNPYLNWAYDEIIANTGRSAEQWMESTDENLRQLRRRYFHMSSHHTPIEGAFELPLIGTRVSVGDVPVYPNVPCFFHGGSYSDDEDVILNGVRKRKVHDG